ncbi:MAG: glycosyltransferase [Nitrososphaerales archaeon]
MKKVYAGVFGSGLGHIARIFSIASAIETNQDAEFVYSTFDEAYDFLLRMERSVMRSPSVGVEWNLAGGFSGKDTIVRFPLYLLRFSKQVAFETKEISNYNPRVVLSDSRLSTIIGAKAKFFPVVTILNQFKILFPPRFRQNRLSRFYERIEGDVLGLLWTLSDEILFPDLPPPFTLAEANIAGTDVSNKVHYTGFMNQKITATKEKIAALRDHLGFDSRPVIYIQISGPEPTKPPLINTAIEAAKALSEDYNVVISKGQPHGSEVPFKMYNGTWIYEWCPVKDELFLLSDVVVTRGGHTTLSQCIEQAKTAVVVPIYNHSEQIWNANKFVNMNLGLAIRSENLSAVTLATAVRECQRNDSFRKDAVRLKKVSDRYDGISSAVETINEFL